MLHVCDISDVLAKFTEYAQNLEVAMGKDVSTLYMAGGHGDFYQGDGPEQPTEVFNNLCKCSFAVLLPATLHVHWWL